MTGAKGSSESKMHHQRESLTHTKLKIHCHGEEKNTDKYSRKINRIALKVFFFFLEGLKVCYAIVFVSNVMKEL